MEKEDNAEGGVEVRVDRPKTKSSYMERMEEEHTYSAIRGDRHLKSMWVFVFLIQGPTADHSLILHNM